MPIFSGWLARGDKAVCISNLRALHAAAGLYIEEHGHWPQIDILDQTEDQYASEWTQALKPYHIELKNWVCPTFQKSSGDPDLIENPRIDYFPTPFDSGTMTPYRWPTQPWFIERGDFHGNGAMLIYTDGSITEMNELLRRLQRD